MIKHLGDTSRMAMVSVLIVAAALTRLLPHPPNFTPIGAMALFSGAYLGDKRLAFTIPLGAMLLSDLIIGFHSLMPVVYGCFAIGVWMGFGLRNGIVLKKLGARTIGFSVLFFAVTNFAVWISGNLYPHTSAGLTACFIAAIPFFQNMLLGDVVFSGTLFGGFALIDRLLFYKNTTISRMEH